MLSNRTIIQNGWVVDDLFAAIKKWTDFYGVGPFWVSEQVVPDDVLYRGEPAHLDMKVALAQAGNVQIELIQQNSDGPSAYRDFQIDLLWCSWPVASPYSQKTSARE